MDPRPRSDRGIPALSRGDRGRPGLAISGIRERPEDAEHFDDVPFGHAQFEASAAAIETFLARTYELVPDGDESEHMDFDAELNELLSQA